MIQTIYPSAAKGSIQAPPSKSLTQRAIAAGLLALGNTTIRNPSLCHDSESAIHIASALGASVSFHEEELYITGGIQHSDTTLNCGESGLAMRMFAPIAALREQPFIFTGQGSLLKRPVRMIEEALTQLGASIDSKSGYLPFILQGPINGGKIVIDASVSSQLLTGLLIALPLAPTNSAIKVSNLKSSPYIDLTLELLSQFGIRIENRDYQNFIILGGQSYNACEYTIEGDWSSSAFILVAGAINGHVVVKGLNMNSKQADIAILKALQNSGANVTLGTDHVQVESSSLHSFQFDASDCPDLFPPLAALAAYCQGTSEITGTGRLIYKESNRAETIREELGKLGISIKIIGNKMRITGSPLHKATLNSHNDHRIAMMAAICAVGADGPITISNAECIKKSYPDFFETLSKIGIKSIKLH